jgi:hypothetical protein
MNGGHLHFEMGSQPNKVWGSSDEDIPVSQIGEQLILPVPYLVAKGSIIREPMQVEIETIIPDCEIYYTLDGSMPGKNSRLYSEPLSLDKTTTLTAIAWKEGYGFSNPVEGNFIKIDINRSIEITPPQDANYHAGGPEALIDGLRGAQNFRLGGWHGYWGIDFEAVVDLGKVQPIRYVGAGFLQEIRSWIWMPKDVTFLVSDDGKNFKQVAYIKNTIAIDDYTDHVKDFASKVNTTGRYVKVLATTFGRIPEWHLGAGGEAWLFIDEIIVE